MRSFVAVIAIASIIGIVTARQDFAWSATRSGTQSAIGRLSDIAARPLQKVLPPPPPPEPEPPQNKTGIVFSAPLTAQGAIAIDHVTGGILFEKNAEVARPLASITKLMSAIIIAEHISDWNTTTTVAITDVEAGNQTIGAGEVYTLDDLYTAALVGSYNTAIEALVSATGITRDAFIAEMNQRAKDLGMNSFVFADPTGLSPLNVGSPRDIAQLTKIALSSPKIKVTSMRDKAMITELVSNKQKTVKATDWLLTETVQRLKGARVEGGKTGFIPEAGYNFTVQIKNDAGHEIRVVVLGTADVFARFTEAADIANWVNENFEWSAVGRENEK